MEESEEKLSKEDILISGLKMIAISSPMDYETLAKETLEKVGIDTSDPKNLRP